MIPYAFTQQLTEDEFVGGMMQALSPVTPLQRWLAWCLVILGLPLLIILSTNKDMGTKNWVIELLTVFLIMGVLILGGPQLIVRSARKHYRSAPSCEMPVSYTIKAEGLDGEVNGASWRTTWPNFVKMTEVEKFVFCYLSKSSVLILKKQLLSDDAIRFLREKIVQPDEPSDELYRGKIT